MGTKLFKLGGFEKELATSMQKSLISNQLDNRFNLDKVAKAADYINLAAELLDKTGFKIEADMLDNVLKSLANDASHDVTEEVAALLQNQDDERDLPEEIIIEPLEQEIVAPSGRNPLSVNYHNNEIFEEKPEILNFESLAIKMAAKMAKKKV